MLLLLCTLQVSAVMEFQSLQPCTAAAVVTRGSIPCCAAGYADGCLRLFDLSTASLAWSAQHQSSGTAIMAVQASPDGKELLTIARCECWFAWLPKQCHPNVHDKFESFADDWIVVQNIAYQRPQRLDHGLHSIHCFRLTVSRHFVCDTKTQAVHQSVPAALSDGVPCLDLSISKPDS